MELPRRLQLHLALPYKHEPRRHPRVRSYLAQGYRIVQLQRISDGEVLVTFALPPEPPPSASPPAGS